LHKNSKHSNIAFEVKMNDNNAGDGGTYQFEDSEEREHICSQMKKIKEVIDYNIKLWRILKILKIVIRGIITRKHCMFIVCNVTIFVCYNFRNLKGNDLLLDFYFDSDITT